MVPSFSAFLRLLLKRKMPIGTVMSADTIILGKSPITKNYDGCIKGDMLDEINFLIRGDLNETLPFFN